MTSTIIYFDWSLVQPLCIVPVQPFHPNPSTIPPPKTPLFTLIGNPISIVMDTEGVGGRGMTLFERPRAAARNMVQGYNKTEALLLCP